MKKSFFAAFALCSILSARADSAPADFHLSGTCETAITLTSSTNATVTLDNFVSTAMLTLSSSTESAVTFTIYTTEGTTNQIEVSDNNPAISASGCNLVFDGGKNSSGKFISKKRIKNGGIIECADLAVEGGDTTVKFDQDKPDTSCVLLSGNFVQNDGTFMVNMPKEVNTNFTGVCFDKKNTSFTLNGGTFECKVGGEKSAAVSLKGSCTANLAGGKFKGLIRGYRARMIAGGTQIFNGTEVSVELDDEVAAERDLTYARCFNADKAITISGGVIDCDVPTALSEVFSCDASIDISGGEISVKSGEDCFHAESDINVSGGRVYAYSYGDDALDANNDINITGGLVLAYTFGDLTHGLDVNDGHYLRVSGGTVIAIGGTNSVFEGTTVATAPYYKGEGLTASAYDGKYLQLVGTNETGKARTTTVLLPSGIAQNFSLFVTAPGITNGQAPTLTDEEPDTTKKIGFHRVYVVDEGVTDTLDEIIEDYVDGVTDSNRVAVREALDTISKELDDDYGTTKEWFAVVYSDSSRAPAETVIGAQNVKLSVKLYIPLMTEESPESEITAFSVGDEGIVISFTVEGASPKSLENLKSFGKVIKSATSVDDLKAFASVGKSRLAVNADDQLVVTPTGGASAEFFLIDPAAIEE